MKRKKEKEVVQEFFRQLFIRKDYLDKTKTPIKEDQLEIIKKAKSFYH